jgi:protein-S-isoprenylcysteine O-methyltransferase Ste14
MSTPDSDRPDVVARPPLLYLGGLALGLALEALWPTTLWSGSARTVLGGVAMSLGAVLLGLCVRRFLSAGTNVPTNRPANALVTDGPYRYSRNPIYLGLSAIYVGLGLLLDSAWVLALLVPVLLVLRYGVIAREEAYLARKFGDDYRRYMRAVRRWL